MALEKIKIEGEPCQMCNSDVLDEFLFGPLFRFEELVIHQFCLLFSYAAEQNGDDDEGILGFLARDIRLGLELVKRNVCCFCLDGNASVKCANKTCEKIFHLPCGIENGSMHQFKGRFQSFCPNHRPKQRIPSAVLARARIDQPICLICLGDLEPTDSFHVLWASCCRSTWYHRYCLQKFAYSTGWFALKCVTCRDKTKFKRLVEQYGIYVPRQDASWELVPHAYQELYVRHGRCDAEECLCPGGRDYSETAGYWNIMLCRFCGSQGMHARCSGTEEKSWACRICRGVTSSGTQAEE